MKYKTDHMKTNIHLAKDAKILYTTGFFITSNFEALMLAAQFANENKKPFAINLSAVFLVEGHKTEFLEMVKYADFVFGNEDETRAWGKAHSYPTESLLEITALIAKLDKIDPSRPRYVITTQGKDPVLMSKHDFASNETISKEFKVDLISSSKIVDLNGAGDAFVGGFLAQFALGKDIEECIRAGQWMSSYIIQVSGTNFPYPCRYFYKKREQTFLMIKPDGVQRGLMGDIIKRWEK